MPPTIHHIARVAAMAGILMAMIGSGPSQAQPAPSFHAACADLREELAALMRKDGELVTISVEGPATLAERDEALAYIAACEAPAPSVLCVTYELGQIEVGDPVVLIGALNVVDEDHVLLDPCLPGPPGRD